MSKPSLGRFGLLLVSLLGLMSLFSASALAAGKPTSLTVSSASWGVSHVEIKGTANPNGAATTVQFEYREAPSGAYQIASTKEIGAGTSTVAVGGMVNGLKPQQYYQLRVSATNSYGTTYSWDEYYMTQWGVLGESEKYAPSFESYGTFKMEYSAGGYIPVKLECNELGNGTIGHDGAVGDSYKVNASGCVYYVNGKEICKPASFNFTLNGSFASQTPNIKSQLCSEETVSTITFTEPFFVAMPYEKYTVTQPLTMTAKAILNGGTTVNLTIASTWQLSAGDKGKKFGLSFE